jgi:hypothetical protein
MNDINFTYNFNNNTNKNISSIVNDYVKNYYNITSTSGWIKAMNLFEKNNICIYKRKHIGNSYDLLDNILFQQIKRANYNNLKVSWINLDNKITINVIGKIQFVSFNGTNSDIYFFSETFVINNINTNDIKSSSHIFDFIR